MLQGGNSKTCLIVTASPSEYNCTETMSTLRFGVRAKSIKNKPKVNKEMSLEEYKLLVEKLKVGSDRLKKVVAILEETLIKHEIPVPSISDILAEPTPPKSRSNSVASIGARSRSNSIASIGLHSNVVDDECLPIKLRLTVSGEEFVSKGAPGCDMLEDGHKGVSSAPCSPVSILQDEGETLTTILNLTNKIDSLQVRIN